MTNDQLENEGLQKIQQLLKLEGEEVKTCKPDEIIFREGQTDPNFYLIMGGEIEITKQTSGGENKVIAHLLPGEFLGEGVLSGVIKKPATARAVTEVWLMKLSIERFIKLIKDEPRLGAELLLTVLDVVNHRVNEGNIKLLALYEINQLMQEFHDDFGRLTSAFLMKLVQITASDGGVLTLKNPFSEVQRVAATSGEMFPVEGVDLSRAAIQNNVTGHWLTAPLENLGTLALHRQSDQPAYTDESLRLLILIAELAAGKIGDLNRRDSDKARDRLHQKRISL